MSKQIDKYSYNPNDLLGIGSSGRVLKAVDKKQNKEFALKLIPKSIITDDEAIKQALIDEIQVMQKLKHPKIVQLIEVLSSDNNYYVVQEFCKQDLQQYLKTHHKFPENEALKMLIDLLEGFTELIKYGYLHRGLKPSNIMVTDSGYKLADCGFAKCLESFRKDNTQQENFLFNSPQVLQNQKYTSKCDIWSLGMIMYNVIYGYTPWFGRKVEELIHNIQHSLLDFPDTQVKLSNEFKSFIEGCLAVDEEERFNWDEVFKHKLVAEHFKNYKTQIKQDQIKFLMNDIRQKIIKQNLDIIKLFNELDRNGDKTLEFSEFVVLLHKIDKTMSRQDCQLVFKKLDLDGDKNISFDEFSKWLTDNNTKMTLLSGKFKGNRKSQKNFDAPLTPPIQPIGPQQTMNWPAQHSEIIPKSYNPPQYQQPPTPFQGQVYPPQQLPPQPPYSPQNNPFDDVIRPQQSGINNIEKTILKLKNSISKYNLNIHDLFIKYDQDKDQMLSFQEFTQMLFKVNNKLQQQEAWDIFKIFDINEDQFISFIEFRQVLNLTVERPPQSAISQSQFPAQYNQTMWQNQQQQQPQQPQQPNYFSNYPNYNNQQPNMVSSQFASGYFQPPFNQFPNQQQFSNYGPPPYNPNFQNQQQFSQIQPNQRQSLNQKDNLDFPFMPEKQMAQGPKSNYNPNQYQDDNKIYQLTNPQ